MCVSPGEEPYYTSTIDRPARPSTQGPPPCFTGMSLHFCCLSYRSRASPFLVCCAQKRRVRLRTRLFCAQHTRKGEARERYDRQQKCSDIPVKHGGGPCVDGRAGRSMVDV